MLERQGALQQADKALKEREREREWCHNRAEQGRAVMLLLHKDPSLGRMAGRDVSHRGADLKMEP